MNIAMATLGLKEIGKFLSGSLPSWLSQFTFNKLRQPTGQTFFPTFSKKFPIFFKPKVAIAEFFWKMQEKPGTYSILGMDAMPLSLKKLLLKNNFTGTPQNSSLPYPIINPTQTSAWAGVSTSGSAGSTLGSTSGSNAGAGGFYPGLAGFMGLELSEDVLRANMPEYLPENQVALRQSVRKFLNL